MDEHIEAVQRMQDYIETNLDKNITTADLANASRYSPWYSYRLFVELLHMTPAVYIRRLRLSKSTNAKHPGLSCIACIICFSPAFLPRSPVK